MPRQALLIVLLALTSLACALGGLPGPTPSPTARPPTPTPARRLRVEGVTVSPTTGSGAFNVTVTYAAGSADETLTCAYPLAAGGEGAETHAAAGSAAPSTGTWTFTFTLETPGDYVVRCAGEDNSAGASASLSVPEPTPAPTPTPEPYTAATLRLLVADASSEIKPGYGCVPPAGGHLTVLPDGALEGACDETSADGLTTKHTTLTGRFDVATGAVTFSLASETRVRGATGGSALTNETYTGSGQLAAEDTAIGTADFHLICRVEEIAEGVHCFNGPAFSTGGSVPFELVFSR